MRGNRVWVVRVGVTTEAIQEAKRKRVVAIGWQRMGDCSDLQTREDFRARSMAVSAGDSHLRSDYGQVYRFVREMRIGDTVLTPDRATGEIHVGRVLSDYYFDPAVVDEKFPHLRDVEWRGVIHRDAMSDRLIASMDSQSVVFTVEGYGDEIEALLGGPKEEQISTEAAVGPPADLLSHIREQAHEAIAARLTSMQAAELDRIVTALLHALGLHVRQIRQEERGTTLVAHPDALGLEEPRVRVLVQRRREVVTGQEARSFRMAGAPGDRGLLISLAGFQADALQEPSLSGPALSLVDRDELVRLVVTHYEALDPEAQGLLRLKKVYVPE